MEFDKKIAIFKADVKTKEEAIRLAYEEFLAHGIVHESFIDGALEREKKYPTGLLLESGQGVAIPHTDPEYVKSSQIAFVSLENPIKFYEMANPESEIEVSFIFVLAIKEAHLQLETLQNLMGLFMRQDLVDQLNECNDIDTYLSIIKSANLV